MSTKKGKIASLVEEIVTSPILEMGYLLWDVDYYKEGADYNLLITIESPDPARGIDLDDCERVSRAVSPLLDEKDPIEGNYYLEVSSAGLERELFRPDHFSYFYGRPVRVSLYAPRDGKKAWEGELLSYEEGAVSIRVSDETHRFSKEEVAKVMTIFEGQN